MTRSHDRTELSPLILSFLAGVASASVAWYYYHSLSVWGNDDNDDEDCASRRPVPSSSSSSSSARWMSMDDLASQIGELPALRRRQANRWPWDRPPRRTAVPATDENAPSSSSQQQQQQQTKSDVCIGSIFGMDVGGTLAKLVYFEQKPENAVSGFRPLRERMYRSSVSAQTVLLARRGKDDSDCLFPTKTTSSQSMMMMMGTTPRLKRTRRSTETEFSTSLRKQHFVNLSHSTESNEDLDNLYRLRQESVPDDLHAFGRLKRHGRFHTTENMMEQQQQQPRAMTGGSVESTASSSTTNGGMRKSRSMLELSKSRVEALDRFYNFARRLDSYREGVKDHKLSFYSRELGGEFHFIRFETRRMQNAMDLIRANQLHLNIREMGATGGGAHKFADLWSSQLGIEMKKQDELDSLVAGMQFVLSTVVGECYSFRPHDAAATTASVAAASPTSSMSDYAVGASVEDESSGDEAMGPRHEDRGKGDEWWWSRKVQRDSISYSATYPYLLVTIGTGVSILRVDGPRKHERISGSTIGGGTYWGLIRLLTALEDFEAVMKLAERGDPSKVDMMVGDIYGENSDALEKLGLAADLVASSFGKLVAKDDPASGVKEEDLARALLLMVTINIGQVAYLNAQLHKTSRIYFVGNFLRQNYISQKRLSFAINYWSKGKMEALFLEHEGYFGALGAFLLSQGITHDGNRTSVDTQQSMPANGSHHSQPLSLHHRSTTVDSFL